MTLGVWYHVAGTYDGSNVRIYINGAECGKAAQTGNIDNNTAVHSNSGGPYAFGGHPSTASGGNSFQDSVHLADPMIFAATLTQDDLSNYYHSVLGLSRQSARGQY